MRGQGILLAFLVLIVVGATLSEHFLTVDNLANVSRQASIVGILGIGMTFVILTAGIDLSVGSILGVVAILFASVAGRRRPVAARHRRRARRRARASARSTGWASRRAASSRSS